VSRGRVMRMVRSVEEVAVERAEEQMAAHRAPRDPGCRGTGCARCGRRTGERRGRWPEGVVPPPRLAAALVRMPPEHLAQLRALSARTRVPIAVYYREAVADLLTKYEATP
jgi:hypothetical protein